MIDLIEILGMIAGICTTCSFIPQIRKVWQTKGTKDISLHMYIVYSTGLGLWTLYGYFTGSIAIIVANFVTLLLALSIMIMKLRWERT